MFGSNDIPRITHYNYFESNRYRPVQRTFVINLSEDEKKVINGVVNACKDYSSSYLVTLTHNQSPWKNSYHGYPTKISMKEMEEYFCD